MARVLIRDSFRGDLLAQALSWISIVRSGAGHRPILGLDHRGDAGLAGVFYLLGINSAW